MNELLHRKLRGLLMPALYVERYRSDARYRDQTNELVRSGIAGFNVFEGSTNEVEDAISHLQLLGEGKLLFAADIERGLPMRFRGGTEFPRAMALGSLGDEKLIEDVAFAIATEARAIGITVTFAPVADVNSNPHNPIINIRSFGEDAAHVARCVRAFIRGTHRAGVVAVAKHFPGHGDVAVDSHLELPFLERTEAELNAREYVPFREAIAEGVDAMMVAHIATRLDPEAATLSKKIVAGELRSRLGFAGAVFTDALDMHSVSRRYPAREIGVRAIQAGCDVLLMPTDIPQTIEGLHEALTGGKISLKTLDGSLSRIEKLRHVVKGTVSNNGEQHRELARTAASRAFSNRNPQVTKCSDPSNARAVICAGVREKNISGIVLRELERFILSERIINLNHKSILPGDIHDQGKFFLFVSIASPHAFGGEIDTHDDVRNIFSQSKLSPDVVVRVGSPYFSHLFPNAPTLTLASDDEYSIAVALDAIFLQTK